MVYWLLQREKIGNQEGDLQPLGVTWNVPRDTPQRQPMTVHGATRTGALRRARLRRHLPKMEQQNQEQQAESSRRQQQLHRFFSASTGSP